MSRAVQEQEDTNCYLTLPALEGQGFSQVLDDELGTIFDTHTVRLG